MKKRSNKGFTLIELMIVVAIIGILAAIAIPKFADLISKSKEGATKGGLSAVRSSLQVYYGDHEGIYPHDTLTILTTDGKYINEIPTAKLPGTGVGDSADVTAYSSMTAGGAAYVPAIATDAVGWAYANDDSVNGTWGNFGVATVEEDLKGVIWTTY
jgi:type IV pilus assembly protein PilA